jgi:ATP-dependent RNA helicase DDX41
MLKLNGYDAVSLHGDTAPKERLRNYKSFRSLEKRWLVCTDLGSRGLDFPAVSHVVQCDFPKTVSDYLHRAGRTGRCYTAGTVITLYRKANEALVQHLKNSFHTGVPLKITSSAFS